MNFEQNLKEIGEKLKKSIDDISVLKTILSVIDHTTLEGRDNREIVNNLCNKAKSFNDIDSSIPNVAAVCVYPTMIKHAKENLKGNGINIAAVAGAFPSGQSPLEIRLAEVKYAIDEGADEIDMVISRGLFLEGDYNYILKEVAETKKVCGNVHLKVILETGELLTAENITKASQLSIEAGADFIKTSTGKVSPAATLESVYYMLLVIKEHYEKTGLKIGIKPAGGISDVETAVKFYLLVENILGKEWLNKDLFRIGASRLTDKVFNEISKSI